MISFGFTYYRDTMTDLVPVRLDDSTKWSQRVLLDGVHWAETIGGFTPFDPDQDVVDSPSGNFSFKRVVVPARYGLATYMSAGRGSAAFDIDTKIPALFEKNRTSPWMSITPMEVWSLRPGIKRAKGHVVIGGLGLGWNIYEIAKRPQVKSIRVVERSQELIDWIGPRVAAKCRIPIEFVCDNARTVIPKMTADSAIIDIYPSYGGNEFPNCPDIPSVWIWGKGYPK